MTTVTEKLRAVFENLALLPQEEQDRYAERINAMKLEDLRRAIQDGFDSGQPAPWNLADFKAKAQARLEAHEQQ